MSLLRGAVGLWDNCDISGHNHLLIKLWTLLHMTLAVGGVLNTHNVAVRPVIMGVSRALYMFVCFVALRPKSTSMVMARRSVHLTTLFPGQA